MNKRGWLSKNLVIITLVSLTQDAASELMYPLLPLLLTGLLAAPPVVLGVIEGVADATTGVTRYFAGKWSDRTGRKPFITAGYALAAVGKILVAAATVWPVVALGRVTDRLGKGLRSAPRDALIASTVDRKDLGRAFGFHRAGDTLGAVIGPLLGLLALAAVGDDLHQALWWAIVPAALSVILVLFIREPKRQTPAAVELATELAESRRDAPAATGSKVKLSRQFWVVSTVLVLVALLNFSDLLLLLRISDLGFSTTETVLAYVMFNLVYSTMSYPAGVFTDSWSKPLVYAIGLGAFAVAYIGLGLVQGGPAVYLLMAVYGLFPAFTEGVGKAWVSSLVDKQHLGRAQGIFQSLNAAAVLTAGIWAGLMWGSDGGRGTLPLLISGFGAVFAVVLFLAWSRRGSSSSTR